MQAGDVKMLLYKTAVRRSRRSWVISICDETELVLLDLYLRQLLRVTQPTHLLAASAHGV